MCALKRLFLLNQCQKGKMVSKKASRCQKRKSVKKEKLLAKWEVNVPKKGSWCQKGKCVGVKKEKLVSMAYD